MISWLSRELRREPAPLAGAPVGFIVAYPLDRVDRDQRMMFFDEISVAESHRRRGIGTQLVRELSPSVVRTM